MSTSLREAVEALQQPARANASRLSGWQTVSDRMSDTRPPAEISEAPEGPVARRLAMIAEVCGAIAAATEPVADVVRAFQPKDPDNPKPSRTVEIIGITRDTTRVLGSVASTTAGVLELFKKFRMFGSRRTTTPAEEA